MLHIFSVRTEFLFSYNVFFCFHIFFLFFIRCWYRIVIFSFSLVFYLGVFIFYIVREGSIISIDSDNSNRGNDRKINRNNWTSIKSLVTGRSWDRVPVCLTYLVR